MRAAVGAAAGEGGLLDGTTALAEGEAGEASGPVSGRGEGPGEGRGHDPDLSELAPPPVDPIEPPPPPLPGHEPAAPERRRQAHLPSLVPDPDPGEARSRFDADDGVVLYNDRHADYLLVKENEPALLDYLATLVAKEYVVFNNPRATPEDLAEEMVRMLVRVRRHLPKRG